MREAFRPWLRPTDDEFEALWHDCIFTFDTNVLLNLYRYSEDARSDLLAAMESVQDRVWLPHQVGFEFYRNRIRVVAGLRSVYQDLLNKLGGHEKALVEDVTQVPRYSRIDKAALTERIQGAFGEFKAAVETHLRDVVRTWPIEELPAGDEIEGTLSEYFSGNIGPEYDPDKLAEIYKDGRARYTRKTPPGYEDEKGKDEPDKFGDLVMWYQVLDHASAAQRPVILVTDERKEDWVRESSGRQLGPRPELVQEFQQRTGQLFWLYSPQRFLERSQSYLNTSVKAATVEEVEDVSAQEEPRRSGTSAWAEVVSEFARIERDMEVARVILDSTSIPTLNQQQAVARALRSNRELAELLRRNQEYSAFFRSLNLPWMTTRPEQGELGEGTGDESEEGEPPSADGP